MKVRRFLNQFLTVFLITLAAVVAFPLVSMAKGPSPVYGSVSLPRCLEMNPVEMAGNSSMVQLSFAEILQDVKQISDLKVRDMTLEILNNPAPTIMTQYQTDPQKAAVKQKLVAAGYLKPEMTYDQFLPPCADPLKAPQPFYAAPGSGYQSHHSYPGGLATHTAVNLRVAMTLYNAYAGIYCYEMDKDLVIAAEALHDLAKPWVFQWRADGSSLAEAQIAGAGAHHILGIAEAIHRGLPANVIVAMACAHTPPDNTEDEKQVGDYLKAGAILAGQDPIQYGLLASDGRTLPLPRRQESFITHLGDHDYVLTGPAASWMIAELGSIAKQEYGMSDEDLKGMRFNLFRDYIFSRVSAEYLDQVWVDEGKQGIKKVVKQMIAAEP